ncbi:uncharacterized protein N7500_003075 [Penicillium coprophilum]|uniref:uncharacterized protein n=1 Tax=Penicillium coprophilum TaxID=36646 RepID=UPI0023A72AFD|nr:uncharacterized protein N7500_003075 [Penicillium coprophilum]KAJ5170292.1 hypothetical protein N7500_003075 [Penicillium coprophilum]
MGKTDGIGQSQEISTNGLVALVNSGLSKNILAVVENIHPTDIETLGSYFDIDPFFFCGHIASSYEDIEKTHSPPLLALPPSRLISRAFVNIHYQKVLDLGDESVLGPTSYHLALSANVPRRVRRLPVLSGILLVDPASDIVVHPGCSDSQTLGSRITQIPRRIGVEAFCDPPTYAKLLASNAASSNFQALNPNDNLLSFFHVLPPGWKAGNPSMLSLAYYPIQVVIQEWMLYGLLMGRYIKYYEYSFKTVPSRLEQFEKHDIIDLHRWRRRSLQSLHKLQIMRLLVEHWIPKVEDSKQNEAMTTKPITHGESSTWNLLIADIKYCEDQIVQHSRSLEAMNPIITSLVQLMDSHKSISQAEDVRRLTYIAMAFIPLTFITGIFSMNESYGPGSDRFWVYWAVALPTAAFIMGILALDGRFAALVVLCAKIRKRVVGPSNPV